MKITKSFDVGFTAVPNEIFSDKRVSPECLGLYAYFLNKPDGWDFSLNGIMSQMNVGRNKLIRIIDELCSLGYLEKHKRTDSKGRILPNEYIIHKEPYFPSKFDNPTRITQLGLSNSGNGTTSNNIKSNKQEVKEEEESLRLSFTKFLSILRSDYVGLPFEVDGFKYYVSNSGYVTAYDTNKKVASGRAKDILQRLYKGYISDKSVRDYFVKMYAIKQAKK